MPRRKRFRGGKTVSNNPKLPKEFEVVQEEDNKSQSDSSEQEVQNNVGSSYETQKDEPTISPEDELVQLQKLGWSTLMARRQTEVQLDYMGGGSPVKGTSVTVNV